MNILGAERLHGELVAIAGAGHVVADEDALAPYTRDQSPFAAVWPGIAVRPADAEQVAEVLRLANACGAAVVPRGGGFSIAGFPPVGQREAIFLDTRRMNRVLDVDEVNRTITAEAGIVMVDLHAAAREHGMHVQTVYVPLRYSTLGGVLSGVVGGGLPINSVNGTLISELLGLRVVLPTGSIVRTNAGGSNVHRATSTMPDGDGPFLTPMFVGDGGSLGVKVEATMRLEPAPTSRHIGVWELPDFGAALRAVRELTALREIPATDISVLEAERPDAPRIVSVAAVSGDEVLLARNVAVTEQVMRRCGGRPGSDEDVAIAETMTEPGGEWATKFLELGPVLIAFVLANSDFEAGYWRFRELLARRFEERGLTALGLVPTVVFAPISRHCIYVSTTVEYERDRVESREAMAELMREAYELVAELGAYSEPHQGDGARISAGAWSDEYRGLVGAVKAALDPNGVLNPGLWEPRGPTAS